MKFENKTFFFFLKILLCFIDSFRGCCKVPIPAVICIELFKQTQIKYVQWLAKTLVVWAYILSTRKFGLLKSCPTLTLLPPNKGRLEVYKNVQYVSVAQWAAKLQLVKLEVIFHKVWHCTTLQPFELQRFTAPFRKLLNPIYLKPSG